MYNYIQNRDLRINRLYFDISNSNKKQCLTIGTRDVNNLGPAKFRAQANNNKSFNSFIAMRKQTSPTSELFFLL